MDRIEELQHQPDMFEGEETHQVAVSQDLPPSSTSAYESGIATCDGATDDEDQEDDTEDDSFSSFDVLQQKIILDAILGSSTNAVSAMPHSPAGKKSTVSVHGFHAAQVRSWKQHPRERLESWGGLSDASHPLTSVPHFANGMAQSSSLQDVEEYMNDESSSVFAGKPKQHPKKRFKGLHHEADPALPLKIVLDTSMDKMTYSRDRLDSITSFPGFFSRDRLDSIASLGEASINMTLTEQLADLAGTLENVVGGLESMESCNSSVSHTHGLLSAMSHHRIRFESTAESSLASSDHAYEGINIKPVDEDLEVVGKAQANSPHMTNSAILVDSDAVQAAVEAAMAVTGKLEYLASQSKMDPSTLPGRTVKRKQSQKRQLPTWSSTATPIHSNRKSTTPTPIILPPSFIPSIPLIDQSTDAHMEAIRAKARAAAGYVHPSVMVQMGGGNAVTPPPPPPSTNSRSKSRSHTPKYVPSNTTPVPLPISWTGSNPNPIPTTNDLPPDHVPTSLPPLKKRATFVLNPPTNSLDPNLPPTSYTSTPKRKHTSNHTGLTTQPCTDSHISQGSEPQLDSNHGNSSSSRKKMLSKSNPTGNDPIEKEGRKRSRKRIMEHGSDSNPHSEETCEEEGIEEEEEDSKKTKVLSNQKWDDMYMALLEYKKIVTETETISLSEQEKNEWVWSGNVPTTYKTQDGKALGRWVNNQRSAKSRGLLRSDRENRLVSSGLKWSVISTNGWADMMNELRVYVGEKTKDGKKWDGNVPTAYKTTSNMAPDGTEIDEDKNLGRWINRQRCLYQSGKLKKERQAELENLGLKWVVLSTTSWNTMYDCLCVHVGKRKAEGTWDGIVPSCFETDDSPPKKLGRWVNRQRSAYLSSRLKDEFYIKLKDMGIKWADGSLKKLVQNDGTVPDDMDFDGEDDGGDEVVTIADGNQVVEI